MTRHPAPSSPTPWLQWATSGTETAPPPTPPAPLTPVLLRPKAGSHRHCPAQVTSQEWRLWQRWWGGKGHSLLAGLFFSLP